MQILHRLKNSESGFSLLECVLAIAILSIVIGTIVGLQSSIISSTQISGDNMKASWAMRSAISQLQYLVDTGGASTIPNETDFPWITDEQFKVNLIKKELKDVKPSQFLLSALGVFNLISPDGNEQTDVTSTFSAITPLLDAPAGAQSQSFFNNVTISVNWKDASVQRNISEGFFLIDKNALQGINLPNLGGDNKNQNPPQGGK
ncbi:type IV pilus modification PilV family protein [Fluviispira multicolorata]|uniref:Prepilin-type N-terminal cleavage/methylation domain-containing protein n=1 Tax=Fluviispira multicolorata TaxID=2654512 RepID=A0A833JEC7_9BACT|nr:prepilin-type N-terminal cleavage/methylation domain-containing protein [Fluviispira multicolorata]KAB8031997.1 prepilin-type N-terminal cleavage/methylation domain-containing protein [Fluviispira multicolorata]